MTSYSLIFALAIALATAASWRAYGHVFGAIRIGRWIDVCLCAFAAAIAAGRAAHVIVNWAYFSENIAEALRPSAGGMDGMGALLGGVVGAAIGARWQRLPLKNVYDALTWALPLMALAGWLGCASAGGRCGYGREIETLAYTSPLIAAELPDVFGIIAPRYQTQLWGAALALCLLGLVALCFRRGWLVYRRFWLALVLLAASTALTGVFRG